MEWGPGFLEESSENIKLLGDDHIKKMISVRFTNNISHSSLLYFVNPSILRLSEEDDKSGMGKLGPFFI
ncbi:hypothetical protein EDC94DRAFT_621831 [Helicostylum pulchrum]|nr:hypothetical protein EDC94DRAFT_621831 [Helicostylum pulchrum]